jgi:hypothetical protein
MTILQVAVNASNYKKRGGQTQQRTIGYEERDHDDSHAGWDEDDWMLFVWSNAKAMCERHRRLIELLKMKFRLVSRYRQVVFQMLKMLDNILGLGHQIPSMSCFSGCLRFTR